MENLKIVAKQFKHEIGLTIVYFKDGNEMIVEKLLEESRLSISGLSTEFVILEQPFSRAVGLQTGATTTFMSNAVMFFCDVDMLFSVQFLDRCISSPIENYQVTIVLFLYSKTFVN